MSKIKLYEKLQSKFIHYTTLENIENWIDNFRDDECDLIIPLIERYRIFDEPAIFSELNNIINNDLSLFKRKYVYCLPCGPAGKSGMYTLYFLNRILKENNLLEYTKVLSGDMEFKKIDNDNEFPIKNTLMIVDDIIGSGETVLKFLEIILSNIYNDFEVIILSLVSYVRGEQRIKKKYPNIKLFSAYHNVRGAFYRASTNMIKTRKLCYTYGKKLYVNNPLGFNNIQGLVSFSFTTPNTTLPIFWSSKKDWFPIFPRFASDKISQRKDLRKSVLEELSIIKTLGTDDYLRFSVGKSENFRTIKTVNFLHYFIIKLSNMKIPIYKQLEISGMSDDEYNIVIQELRQENIFDGQSKLTDLGKEIYYRIQKDVHEFKRNKTHNSIFTKEKIYIPRDIRGIR